MDSSLQPFDEFQTVRKVYVAAEQDWYYVIVDILAALTETANPSRYWSDMKTRAARQATRLGREELFDFIVKFPFKHPTNNRTYQYECANRTGVLRIVQDIQSNNELVERLKLWMAETAARRLDEIEADPIELEREKYRRMGRSEAWITARLGSKSSRNTLTDEWKERGIEGREYGSLTNVIHKGTFDVTVGGHKRKKGLDKGDLRDHMTPRELAFTILGEDMTTTELRKRDAQGYGENREAAQKGGEGAGKLRRQFEELTGEPVVSSDSFLEDGANEALEEGGEDEV